MRRATRGTPRKVHGAAADGLSRATAAMALVEEAKALYASAGTDTTLIEEAHATVARKCRELAVAHGGVYIKAAQLVASLPSGTVVPAVFVNEFAPLTDRVPPAPFDDVLDTLVAEHGLAALERLGRIDPHPVAAGSLAQVHRSGGSGRSPFAIKVQRPNVRADVEADLETFRALCQFVQPGGYDLTWLVDDLDARLRSELDFRVEAQNAEAAAAALATTCSSTMARIPAVQREFTTARTVVTRFESELTRLEAVASGDRAHLGQSIATVFAQLTLRFGLCHGDPHSGNVYGVGRTVVILDHGLYHHPDPSTTLALSRLILACATPWPSTRVVTTLAETFVGPGDVAGLFPLLLSPAFAAGTGASVTDLRAAASGVLPEGVTLEAIWSALSTMRARRGGCVLGVMQSLGYVRKLLDTTGTSERVWVLALATSATQAVAEAEGRTATQGELWLAQCRVELLFLLLWVVAAMLHCCAVLQAAAARLVGRSG